MEAAEGLGDIFTYFVPPTVVRFTSKSKHFLALAEAVWKSRSCALPARMPLAHDYAFFS